MTACDIIIPYYQREAGVLSRAIASVAAQNFEDWRLIIVDDGSPSSVDPELDGLDEASRRRIHVVHKPNGGVGSARNAGLDAVREDAGFVAFLDSDDVWAPGHLNRCADALSYPEVDIFWAAVAGEGFAENYAPVSKVLPADDLARVPDTPDAYFIRDLRDVLCGQWWRHMHLSCTAISRDLAARVRFREDLRFSEDFAFLLACAQRARRAIATDAPGMARGQGDNLWHGAAFEDERVALEKYTMVTLYRTMQRDPALSAQSRRVLDARMEGRRQQFYWNQIHRLKAGKAPSFGLWGKWILRDPSILKTALGRLFKQSPRQERYVIPLDDA